MYCIEHDIVFCYLKTFNAWLGVYSTILLVCAKLFTFPEMIPLKSS